jgi:MoaA/NifB/PqqE/SkfB family radical SAM enzyme
VARYGERLETPPSGLRTWRRRALAYRTLVENYWINRRLNRAGRWDLRPLYFIWTVIRNCNFRCTYCDDHRGRRYPDLPARGALSTEEGIRLLEIMRTRTPSVYFAGGEPMLRKDLPKLTRAARDQGYYPIVLNTNGSLVHRLLVKPDWRGFLADVDILVVSLDGLDLAEMGKLWGYRRPEDVVRNLLILRELASPLQFKLMVNAVIQPGRTSWAKAVLDFANDAGICFCPVPMNVGPTVSGDLASDPDYDDLVETILARKREGYPIAGSTRLNRRLLRSAPFQCRNTLKPHIDYDGRLFWPCKSSVNVEPATVRVLDFDHVDALYAHASRLVEPTRFHGPAKNQCGANCNWAQNYTTDAYHHGLEHPAALARDVIDFLGAAPRGGAGRRDRFWRVRDGLRRLSGRAG